MIFSNPRLNATFSDWPLGGNKRGECKFFTEHKPNKGYRIGRITTGKPKYNTYSQAVAIVDGDNDKTYILCQSPPVYGNSIGIYRSDFLSAEEKELGHANHISERSEPEKYQELLKLIQEAK